MEKTSFMIGYLQSMIFLYIPSLLLLILHSLILCFLVVPMIQTLSTLRMCLFAFLLRVLYLIHFLKLISQRRILVRATKGIQFLTSPCLSRPLDGSSSDLDSEPKPLNTSITHYSDQERLLCKQRRLYRKQILKKKRELGLINIANSKVIRYKQKQTTAMQKNRCNGKFASVLWSVCKKHSSCVKCSFLRCEGSLRTHDNPTSAKQLQSLLFGISQHCIHNRRNRLHQLQPPCNPSPNRS
ncbi:uncharacterized protein [Blastocystis hominis]|uniref:Uncharacterized protein n=1 Tax=Blastocystis hominis TaxID=12968 RepID=D8M7Z1_BLAHO|nr:uncharacterized protein [Blastocystis hominis]CBK24180.2 unnamed protein product [Blastocystis hominis]|eukprot:XP_012898228.1 uncharacterized protein [Blastocystis hominis]